MSTSEPNAKGVSTAKLVASVIGSVIASILVCAYLHREYGIFGASGDAIMGSAPLSAADLGAVKYDPNAPYTWEMFNDFKGKVEELQHNMFERNKPVDESYAALSDNIGREKLRQYGKDDLVKHPVFMIPGFISSALEVWHTGVEGKDDGDDAECGGGRYDQMGVFRSQIWGSLNMLRAFAQNSLCWKRYLMLNPKTGLDPASGIKVRAALGFDASNAILAGGFWIWDKVIKNLAQVGYTASDMTLWSYDWRLEYTRLEQRDGSFTKLKKAVEAAVDARPRREKAVMLGHSMGGPYLLHFLVWVGKPKEEGGGGGGPDWVERYVEAYVDLAGPLLGVPKAAAALLSGETNYATQWGPWDGVVESLFGRKHRNELYNSWGSLWGMTPKGGDRIWGVAADLECPPGRTHVGGGCVDDPDGTRTPSVPFLAFPGKEEGGPPAYEDPLLREYAAKGTWSYADLAAFFSRWRAGSAGRELAYSAAAPPFNDPTAHPLPRAPSLHVYCLYGTGMYNDRMYYYKRQNDTINDVPFAMDASVEDDPAEHVFNSMRNAEGDNTVPLLSLAYPCVELWGGPQKDTYNPGGATVVTKEYPHAGTYQKDDRNRQGPKSSEHCDLLGNREIIQDIIDIASGHGPRNVRERIHSDIRGIAKRIREHPWNAGGPAGSEGGSANGGEKAAGEKHVEL